MEGLLGKTLGQTYRVEQLLGRGGMGAVYRARDVALDRDVAIKVMHPHLTQDETFRTRFLQEARAIAILDHPNIVQVYTFGQDLGLLYIVMDFIAGQNLQAWLKRLSDEHKIIGLAESLSIVQQVALALHYAHEKGILHRDVKPANILLEPIDPALLEPDKLSYRPVLTDFGLAKLAESEGLTLTGTTMGTPSYMSPEQCAGLELTRHTDIYSLGVVLFELITGRVPFEAKSLGEAIRLHTQQPPPPPRSINSSLPVQVENVTLRALAKRAGDRFSTAREMADALKSALSEISGQWTVAPADETQWIPDTAEAGSIDFDTAPTAYVSLMTLLQDEESAPPIASTAPPPLADQIDLFVSTPELTVAPGGYVTASIRALNRGASVERLWISVDGIPTSWLPTLPPALQLLPGAQQTFSVSIQPPHSPDTHPGRYSLTVQVASQSAPDRAVGAKMTLTVAPYSQFRAQLEPERFRAGKRAQVVIENNGNAAQRFGVRWTDPQDELAFDPPQAQLTISPGERNAFSYRAAPRHSHWFGGTKTHPFSATVHTSTRESQSLHGEVLSRGMIPVWVLPVTLFLCILLAGATAVLAGPRLFPGATPTSAPTSEPVVVLPTPTPTFVSATPSATATPSSTMVPPTATMLPPTSTSTPVPDFPDMAWVPAGEFVQGSNQAQIEGIVALCQEGDNLCVLKGLEDELPQHRTYVDTFYIDQHEVTNAEYARCVQAGTCRPPSPRSSNTRDPYFGDPAYARHPVLYVTWHDAQAYCQWAGKRLPTEAEWEKAARGDSGLFWPWGNDFDPNKTNFRPPGTPPDSSDTRPVGSYPDGASPYGALDMVGNVWEWVADWFAPSYEGQLASRNPTGPESGDQRVIRGGSWNSNIASARAASRAGSAPDRRYFDVGFRCAR